MSNILTIIILLIYTLNGRTKNHEERREELKEHEGQGLLVDGGPVFVYYEVNGGPVFVWRAS